MSTAVPISFAGSQLAETRHVCAFFNSDDEEYRVLLPFIKDGLECGHKAVHVVNPGQRSEHMQRLAAAGIDPAAAEHSGQLELRTNTETYLRDGRFDKDRMLRAFEQIASGNAPGGFPLSRIVCRMDWAAEGKSYVNDLIEFESRVNHVWEHHDDAVICTYHLGKFGGDIGDRHHAHASYDHYWRNPATKSILRTSGRIPSRVPRATNRAQHIGLSRKLAWRSNPKVPPRKAGAFGAASTI